MFSNEFYYQFNIPLWFTEVIPLDKFTTAFQESQVFNHDNTDGEYGSSSSLPEPSDFESTIAHNQGPVSSSVLFGVNLSGIEEALFGSAGNSENHQPAHVPDSPKISSFRKDNTFKESGDSKPKDALQKRDPRKRSDETRLGMSGRKQASIQPQDISKVVDPIIVTHSHPLPGINGLQFQTFEDPINGNLVDIPTHTQIRPPDSTLADHSHLVSELNGLSLFEKDQNSSGTLKSNTNHDENRHTHVLHQLPDVTHQNILSHSQPHDQNSHPRDIANRITNQLEIRRQHSNGIRDFTFLDPVGSGFVRRHQEKTRKSLPEKNFIAKIQDGESKKISSDFSVQIPRTSVPRAHTRKFSLDPQSLVFKTPMLDKNGGLLPPPTLSQMRKAKTAVSRVEHESKRKPLVSIDGSRLKPLKLLDLKTQTKFLTRDKPSSTISKSNVLPHQSHALSNLKRIHDNRPIIPSASLFEDHDSTRRIRNRVPNINSDKSQHVPERISGDLLISKNGRQRSSLEPNKFFGILVDGHRTQVRPLHPIGSSRSGHHAMDSGLSSGLTLDHSSTQPNMGFSFDHTGGHSNHPLMSRLEQLQKHFIQLRDHILNESTSNTNKGQNKQRSSRRRGGRLSGKYTFNGCVSQETWCRYFVIPTSVTTSGQLFSSMKSVTVLIIL